MEGPSTCSFCVVDVFSPPVDLSVEGKEEGGGEERRRALK